MGKQRGWFSALKRALYSDSSEKKDQKRNKSKKKWFGKSARSPSDTVLTPGDVDALPIAAPPPPSPLGNLKLAQVEDEQSKHAYSVALAIAVAAEAAVAAAQAAAEVARRALRALRGLMRLKTLIEGQSVKRQAATTLRYMQMLSRLQVQVRARRIRMSKEKLALQRQLKHKQEKEIEKLRLAGSWNDSTHSKEQMEVNLLHKQEAAIRRERALAYLFSHQKTWKNFMSANQMLMDLNNPYWGWSWLERWMALRSWDARTTRGKANDRASLKSEGVTSAISVGELNRSNSSRRDSSKPSSTTSQRYSPSTPTSNDLRSMFSVQSEMGRRHSITGSSSVRDGESIASMPTVLSYMAPTMSTKAKS